ncbi:MAG: NAD(P)H-dependent oxidoreductase subunit E [Planctomycetota bacterium]
MEQLDLTFVDRLVGEIGTSRASSLLLLQKIQNHFGYLPAEALHRLCELTEITPALITSVATFYNQFRHQPAGKYRINVCVGTACHVKGSANVYDAFRRCLKIADGSDTDPQGIFTVEKIACLGCCTLAPAVKIDRITYGHLTPDSVADVIHDFLQQQQIKAAEHKERHRPDSMAKPAGEIRIGLGSCCISRGSEKVCLAAEQTIEKAAIDVSIKQVGCVGMCHRTPLLEIVMPDGESFLYAGVRSEDVESILFRHFKPKGVKRKISSAVSGFLDKILTDERHQSVSNYAVDVREKQVAAFLGPQKNITTEYCGRIGAVDLKEYLAYGGFDAFKTCLSNYTPQQVIDQISKSGLRGRGGAGFPVAQKWQIVCGNPSEKKYLICNGDEGDPGAFMDRMLLESYPYRIIEGIVIAAYAVGADQGYFYIRAEYPLAVERIRQAVEKCREQNLLGENIFGSEFNLDLQIVEGAGAFVCGEESALIAALEGRRGTPRLRPPYPSQQGLWGKSTLVNNVETYATVPWVIRNGAPSFASIGVGSSKGTKVFALAGKVARGGLIEVPMGITIRQIVEEIGGGAAGGRKFKAVQIGGPSGGCIPAHLSDVQVDYEQLQHLGAIMGSGGLVVLDDSDCMVDIARYFLQFTQNQSCGKCTFCRIGTRRMLDIMDRICQGRGRKGDIEKLRQLGQFVKTSSLCGLGRTAPNPVLTTIKYFRSEYEAHLENRCPAGKCRALIRYLITDDCIGCTLCAQHCPVDAIGFNPYSRHEIDSEKCIRCGTCKNLCPEDAVEIK